MIYPLALMSIITVVLIFVFLMTVRRNAVVSDRFMDHVEALVGKRDYAGLISLSHRSSECMARITQKTLDFMAANPNSSFENVRDVAQAEGSHQAGILTSRITYLSDIGSIAPMVGLLGTVIGMIKAFIEISAGGVQGVRQMGLAEGVSEALIATAGGLCISIAALIFYSIFRGKVHKYTSELEAAATHFLAILHTQHERQQEPATSQPGNPVLRSHEHYRAPIPSPLAGERPDLHGI
ncbi:MAG: MotA/TolQ/ExbB proton channel family protein [Akkermansiaceae bacterium]|nr:MotA/TolQ/ExbB proton channel family protein [Akkermansiaceae bacterium]